MKLLNGDMLINHINEKKERYMIRIKTANSLNDDVSATDYKNRIVALDSLLVRVLRGDFEVDLIDIKPPEPTIDQMELCGQ